VEAERRTERNVLVVTGVAHAATHFAELMFPTLAVVVAREQGLPLDVVLGWSFVGYLLFGLGALPGGYLADHVGARPVVLASLLGIGGACLVASFTTPGVPLAAALALLGLFGSLYHPAGMGLITRAVRARGRGLAINGIFGNVGIALTPAVTGALATQLGWAWTFRVAGLVLLAIGVACACLPIDEPATSVTASTHAASHDMNGAWLPIVLLCVAAALGGVSYRGNTLVQPAFFAERVSFLSFGVATSSIYLIGIVGQYLGGMAADRFDLRWGYLGFHLASLPALLAMGALWGVPLLGAASVFVFFSLGMQPIENSLFARLTSERWRSTGYGFKFVLTFGVGSTAVWLVRCAEGSYGLAAVFGVLAGVVALLCLSILLLIAVTTRPAPVPAPSPLA
jgi:predicted MFS family arabinose efflux permease